MKRTLFRLALTPAFVAALSCLSPGAEQSPPTNLSEIAAAAASYRSGDSLEPFRRLEEGVRLSISKPGLRKEIEAALIRLLEPNATFEARRFACKQLGIIGSKSALPSLAKLLKDDETVGIACLALTTYPAGAADPSLREGLKWVSGTSRIQILNALGDRRDPKSFNIFTHMANDEDEAIAEAAIAALGKLGTADAAEAIAGLRKKPGPGLNQVLAEAALRCADRLQSEGDSRNAKAIYNDLLGTSNSTAVRRSSLAALLRLDPDGAERRILEVLSSTNSALKPVAISEIRSLPSGGASKKFSAEIQYLKPDEQVLLLDALAARGDDTAILTLAKSVSFSEPSVRCAAITALGRIGDPYFATLLARAAVTASSPEESRAVESALVNLKGEAETDKVLVGQLKSASLQARVLMINVVSRRMGSGANPVLLPETESGDIMVAKAAFRALAKTGTSTEVPTLLARLSTISDGSVRLDAEYAAAQVLSRIPTASQRSAIVQQALAKAATVDSRNSLLGLLPGCGDSQALALLQPLASDPEPQVRENAVRALAEWPDASAWDALGAVYVRPESETLRGVALRGMVRLLAEENARPDPKLVERYKQLLAGAKTAADLKLILGALSGAAHPDTLALTLPLLSNPAVRPEAEAAIRKIAEAIKAQHPQAAEEALQRLGSKP